MDLARSGSDFALQFGDAKLLLLPERAVYWPSRKLLLIADTHFGKEATFRNAAIPIPDQTAQQLTVLDQLLAKYRPQRITVLGDLLHSRRGRCETTFRLIADWRRKYSEISVVLVRGNHDVSSGDPPAEWEIECVDAPYAEESLKLIHNPDQQTAGHSIAGHLHPTVRLSGAGRDSVRLPCFMVRSHTLVLPAFSPFVDGAVLRLQSRDQVFGICSQSVLQLPAPIAGRHNR